MKIKELKLTEEGADSSEFGNMEYLSMGGGWHDAMQNPFHYKMQRRIPRQGDDYEYFLAANEDDDVMIYMREKD